MAFSTYVAGSSREVPRVRAIQAALRELGGTISFDWTLSIERAIAQGLTDRDLDDAHAHRCAHEDAEGVFQANLLWLAAPARENPTKGAWWEHGFACGVARALEEMRRVAPLGSKLVRSLPHVLVTGPEARSCIFTRYGSTRLLHTDGAGVIWAAEVAMGLDPKDDRITRALSALDAQNG